MKIYVSGRQTGKTTNVLEWFLEDPYKRGVICMDARERQRLCEKVDELRPDLRAEVPVGEHRRFNHRRWIYNIVYPQQLPGPMMGKKLEAIWIDNFDLVLRGLLSFWNGDIIANTTEPVEVINADPGDRSWT